jgi:hypothetical protein
VASIAVAVVALASSMMWSPPVQAIAGGNEGCAPSFWLTHLSTWPGTNPADDDFGNKKVIAPGGTLAQILGGPALTTAGLGSFKKVKLQTALTYADGVGLSGTAMTLFRVTATAWLNAADDRMNYAYRRTPTKDGIAAIKPMVKASLGNTDQMLAVAATLDAANNGVGGCPVL